MRTHARPHAHAHTHIRIRTCMCMRTHTHTNTRTHTLTHAHAYAYAHIHACTRPCTYVQALQAQSPGTGSPEQLARLLSEGNLMGMKVRNL